MESTVVAALSLINNAIPAWIPEAAIWTREIQFRWAAARERDSLLRRCNVMETVTTRAMMERVSKSATPRRFRIMIFTEKEPARHDFIGLFSFSIQGCRFWFQIPVEAPLVRFQAGFQSPPGGHFGRR